MRSKKFYIGSTGWLKVCAMLWVLVSPFVVAAADPVNCNEIVMTEKTHTHEVDPADLRQCLMRGWDPPTGWRPDDGKSPGIKVGGAGGFSYGTVYAPEASAGARKARASVKKEVIKSTCMFPPRVKLGFPPKVEFPKGSCYDFFNDLMKDKDGATYSSPPPDDGVLPEDTCPAENDSTGTYGVKTDVSGGGTYDATCGAMLPVNNVELVLNKGATNIAVTKNGTRSISFYKKNGSSFSLVGTATLPSYLCTLVAVTETTEIWEKSADLTPAISQIISYDASIDSIAVRLQSREFMDPNYIPPYDDAFPEKYLIIRVNDGGMGSVPGDCADESSYFQEPTQRQDILIEPSYIMEADCNGVNVDGTQENDAQPSCPADATMGQDGKCRNNFTGAEVAPIYKDNWQSKCPDSSSPTGFVNAPPEGCPHKAGIPGYETKCTDGSDPVAGKCSNTGDFVIEPPSCGTAATLCDVVTLIPRDTTGSCQGKLQYAVLTRPNLYYPIGTKAVTYPVSGQTFGMADTVNESQFYASGQTLFYLQPTAPTLTFNEGGFVRLKDGSIVIMNPSAKVTASSGKIEMSGGGQRVSSGGTQVEEFGENSTYTIPASILPSPMEIKVGRSVFLPSGFIVPTANAPYLRQPIDKPPE